MTKTIVIVLLSIALLVLAGYLLHVFFDLSKMWEGK
jgi:hypothetical protein